MKGRVAQLEIECLQVLWSAPGASVAQVKDRLNRPLAYTTVLTVLDRMAAKGLVTRRKQGRAYSYSAALEREAARAQAVEQLVSNLFERDPRALMEYLRAREVRFVASVRALSRTVSAGATKAQSRAARRAANAPASNRPLMDDVLL